MRIAIVIAAVVTAGAVAAGGACKLAFDCHLRSVPLLSKLVSQGDPLVLADPGTDATSLPAGFHQEVIATGLAFPTAFTILPDGRILVAEKNGLVRVLKNGRLLTEPFLDVRDRVATQGFRGILGIKAHPGFSRNGWVYVHYTRAASAQTEEPVVVRVSRFEAEGDRADPAAEEIILGGAAEAGCTGVPAGADCISLDGDHAGGGLAFAADGSLLVTTGDGWHGGDADRRALRAQSLDQLEGKLLRVTPEGEGLPDNPFWTGDASANRSKVWAYGFRNPFRLALDPENEDPWVADVGWNDFEEINRVVRGGNYGWPCFEGNEPTDAYASRDVCRTVQQETGVIRMPLHTYPASSITGGAFLLGDHFPPRYHGAYVFGDWAHSWLRIIPRATSEPVPKAEHFAADTAGPAQIELAPDGSIVYAALNAGELRRISYAR